MNFRICGYCQSILSHEDCYCGQCGAPLLAYHQSQVIVSQVDYRAQFVYLWLALAAVVIITCGGLLLVALWH
jgi:predicted amidophosphoribosyltransferase